MPVELACVSAQLSLNPAQFTHMPIAALGAAFLPLGAQFQRRGAATVTAVSSQALPLALVGFVLAAILAILGVFGLAKYPSQTERQDARD